MKEGASENGRKEGRTTCQPRAADAAAAVTPANRSIPIDVREQLATPDDGIGSCCTAAKGNQRASKQRTLGGASVELPTVYRSICFIFTRVYSSISQNSFALESKIRCFEMRQAFIDPTNSRKGHFSSLRARNSKSFGFTVLYFFQHFVNT